jgi:RNA polymerase sigma factor (sigma-70 family)
MDATLDGIGAMNEKNAVTVLTPADIEKLYREHRQHLLRFVQRYVRRPEDSEDVVQSTFVEAVRCADRFSGLSKPSTWLFGIALNLARNHVRNGINEPCDYIDENLLEQLVDSRSDPALLAEMREILSKVDGLLSGLAPNMRTTFEAVLDGALSYEKAAETLRVPVGTIRSRVSRVRSAVRAECDK